MTLPVFPAELSKPMRDSYLQATGDGRRFSQSETGPPRAQLVSAAAADRVQMTFPLSRNQLARLDRFFIEETRRGAKPFLMPDPTTDGWAALDEDGNVLTDEEGTPLLLSETWLCQVGDGLPQRAPRGVEFNVSVTLMVLP